MTSFWFIRHAESESNAGLPSTSPSRTNITDKGEKQARCISNYINIQPSLFVTSKYIRTEQTARASFEKYPETPREIWPIQEFTYLPHHYYYHTTTTQRYPHARKYFWKGDPDYVTCDDAESFNQFRSRVSETCDRLRSSKDDLVILFGHGWFMRTILWELTINDKLKRMEKKNILKIMRERLMTSTLPFTVFSLFGLQPHKRIMYNFLLFSTAVKIPNGAIIKFNIDSSKVITFQDFEISHLPEKLRGSFLVDR